MEKADRRIGKNLAIIPARSGSKGLSDKNILNLDGKPLMAWSIEAALQSKLFEQVMVSTDSERYSIIAQKYGASVPFLRSEKNSSDTASSWDMVREVLKMYQELEYEFDNVVLLQPTSPLRNSADICGAYELFINKKADAVVSVCETEHSPLWSNTLPEDLSLSRFVRDAGLRRRQDMEKYYRINGAIYIVSTRIVLESKDIYGENSYAYIMKKEQSIDIDSEFDFKLAELIKKEMIING